jgi:hypothetical protein
MKTFCSGFIIVKTLYYSSLREKEHAVFPVSGNGNTAIVNFCRMNILPTSFNIIWGEGLPLVISWHKWLEVKFVLYVCIYSKTPLFLILVIGIAIYLDRLDPSGKFVENSTKLTCLEVTSYQIKYSTVL